MTEPESDTPVGYIVGESSPYTFSFVTTPDLVPGKLEYLTVRGVTERIGDQARQRDVLAQVTALGAGPAILTDDLTYQEKPDVLQKEFRDRSCIIGEARIIGYLKDNAKSVHRPHFAVVPGHPLHVADNAFLHKFFATGIESGIEIGHLINHKDVQIKLDPNGLRRHLAIMAQTGAGKSYLAGRLLENLVELGATVVVLDPNADYVQLRKTAQDANTPYQNAHKTPFASRVDLYRIPGAEHPRFPGEQVGPSQPFTIRFADLDLDEICELAGVPERALRQREAVQKAVESLQATNTHYTPTDLLKRLRELESAQGIDRKERKAAREAPYYIEALAQHRIWGQVDFNLDAMLLPQKLTVIDLAGAAQWTVTYVADKVLRNIWRRALADQLAHPVFVLLEQAHTLVPDEGPPTRASSIISTIAREGTKFRVFLLFVTHRPSKVARETLSQCGSQIVMQVTNPCDRVAIENAAQVSCKELMAHLPDLNQGEALVLGPLLRVPALIAVSGRVSAEGGADVDLVQELEKGRRSASITRVQEKRPPAVVAPREREPML